MIVHHRQVHRSARKRTDKSHYFVKYSQIFVIDTPCTGCAFPAINRMMLYNKDANWHDNPASYNKSPAPTL
jgi:hypothetical protein